MEKMDSDADWCPGKFYGSLGGSRQAGGRAGERAGRRAARQVGGRQAHVARVPLFSGPGPLDTYHEVKIRPPVYTPESILACLICVPSSNTERFFGKLFIAASATCRRLDRMDLGMLGGMRAAKQGGILTPTSP